MEERDELVEECNRKVQSSSDSLQRLRDEHAEELKAFQSKARQDTAETKEFQQEASTRELRKGHTVQISQERAHKEQAMKTRRTVTFSFSNEEDSDELEQLQTSKECK